MPERLDVIYILREGIDPQELRYSLRSVEENFPHRLVWFVGGQPEEITPDGRIPHKQHGATPWENVRSSLFEIVRNQDITEDFYLFNDDFFVMKKFTGPFINYAGGTLERKVLDLAAERGANTPYVQALNKCRAELLTEGYDTIDFALHLPMLFNKTKLGEILNALGSPMFRSIYGNKARVPYIYHADVKIYDRRTAPPNGCDFVSTMDDSFRKGKVGEIIRSTFPKPSTYESGGNLNG